jgi:hypothetical protein
MMVDTRAPEMTGTQTECTVEHPLFGGVVCQIHEHPHKVAHFAEGRTDAGVFWNTVWWDQSAVLDDPEGSANHPTT